MLILSVFPYMTYAEGNSPQEIANGIIEWKKSNIGAETYLLNDDFLLLAGSTPGDWYPIGLSRLGVYDNYASYLAVITDKVKERYYEPGKLSAAKATEWHRITLAVLAAGGDPTDMGVDGDGNVINLIADGVYDRGKVTSLGRQGINGWIWGLIALDSKRYEIPRNAYYTRDGIIIEILKQQLSDGGFALSGSTADADMTAMAIQALSPYYNSEKIYTYEQRAIGKTVTKNVRDAVDEALNCLSMMQLDGGDMKSWGTENVESTDQVAVALCCLGIDLFTDSRFIKNGNTLYDGILKYHMQDGGFVHSFTYDADNPTSLPDKSNSMAGEQTLYTMAAIIRAKNDMRTLYDMRREQSESLKARIKALENDIASINAETEKELLTDMLERFYSIPEDERCYVNCYWTLSDAAKAASIDVTAISESTEVKDDSTVGVDSDVLLYFSPSDRQETDSLPEKLTTEYYVTVTTLLDKIQKCEDFDEKNAYFEKLKSAKAQISEIQAEIDSINRDIKEKLYPFEDMRLSDRATVYELTERYKALSEYDRAQIEHWEDVIKIKTMLDNTLRGIIIAVILSAVAVILSFALIKSIRKRRHRHELEMQELSEMFDEG